MNKRNSKVFITTKVYDLLAIDRDEVIKDIQNTIDSSLGPNKVKFTMVVWKKEVILNFFRTYMDELDVSKDHIYCWDADLITGRKMGNFSLPYSWPTVPFGYLFYLDQPDFKECYRKSAKALGASKFKEMVIEPTKDCLTVRLLY